MPKTIQSDVLRAEVEVGESELVEAVERHGELRQVKEGQLLGQGSVVPVEATSVRLKVLLHVQISSIVIIG